MSARAAVAGRATTDTKEASTQAACNSLALLYLLLGYPLFPWISGNAYFKACYWAAGQLRF
jgi:hypothetical protein